MENKKTAVILTPSYLPNLNGMSYASEAHAKILNNLNIETHIITGGEKEKSYYENNFFIHIIKIKGSGLPWNKIHGKLSDIDKKIYEINPDFIISEGWYTWGTYFFSRKKINNIKYIISSHGSAPTVITGGIVNIIKWIGYKYYDAIFDKKIIGNLDASILLDNHQDQERFRDHLKLNKQHIPTYICPNTPLYEKIQHSKLLNKIKNRIILIGEMSETKNQILAAKLIKLALNSIKNLSINFVYPHENNYSRSVKSKIQEYNLCNNVVYTVGKNREEIQPLLEESSLVLVTSKTEAQPISVIDAQAYGLPFIATSVGSLPSMRGGICSSSDHLHELIIEILTNDNLYQQLSKDALQNIESKHSIESITKIFDVMIKEL